MPAGDLRFIAMDDFRRARRSGVGGGDFKEWANGCGRSILSTEAPKSASSSVVNGAVLELAELISLKTLGSPYTERARPIRRREGLPKEV